MPHSPHSDPVVREYQNLGAKSGKLVAGAREVVAAAQRGAWTKLKPPRRPPVDPTYAMAIKESIWIGLHPRRLIGSWKRARRLTPWAYAKASTMHWLYKWGL